MERWCPDFHHRVEFGQARQIQRDRELHAGRRRGLLRLRPDQEESRYRFEFPRAGVTSQVPLTHRTQRMNSQKRELGGPGPDQYRILRDTDLRDYLAPVPEVAA